MAITNKTGRGLGNAPISGAVPTGPAPPVPAAPARNVLGDIGLVLSNVAAGARGQPLPSVARDEANQSRAAEVQRVERDRAKLAMQAIAQLNSAIEDLTPDQVATVTTQFNEPFRPTPGIEDFGRHRQIVRDRGNCWPLKNCSFLYRLPVLSLHVQNHLP